MLKNHDGTAFNPMTYSIVARDPVSGELGVAVATCWPAVGAVVPWVEPGVGAIATQASTNIDLGPMGLAALRDGATAADALRELIETDPARDLRQVGVVDVAGRAASYTGSGCVAQAGHQCDDGVCVQGNMLEAASVWPAMLAAFRGGRGDLADRLLVALESGERAGGDVRGRRSAALLVAPGSSDANPWARRFDLRADGSSQPLDELERLLHQARAFEALSEAMTAIEQGSPEAALERTTRAKRLAPDDGQITLWHAAALFAIGRRDEAQSLLQAALLGEPWLAEYSRRLVKAGRGEALAALLASVRGAG